MEDTIRMGLEISCGVLCGLIGGYQVYKTVKLFKNHSKYSKYTTYIEKNDLKSVSDAVANSDKSYDPKNKKLMFVEGQAVSGVFILKKNARKLDATSTVGELEKLKKSHHKQILYSSNVYKKQGVISDAAFDKDIEA